LVMATEIPIKVKHLAKKIPMTVLSNETILELKLKIGELDAIKEVGVKPESMVLTLVKKTTLMRASKKKPEGLDNDKTMAELNVVADSIIEVANEEKATNSGAFLRIRKDLNDLELPPTVNVDYGGDKTLMNFSVDIKVQGGMWDGGLYKFEFKIPPKYPFDGPKVTCIDKIWHPNIDLQGGVCVNVLRPWKPTFSILVVIFGLLFLFSNPNANDPLNHAAAEEMRKDARAFASNVKRAMKGQVVGGTSFTKNRGV